MLPLKWMSSALLVLVVSAPGGFAQPPQAPPVRANIDEARVLAIEAQLRTLNHKVDTLTAAIEALTAKVDGYNSQQYVSTPAAVPVNVAAPTVQQTVSYPRAGSTVYSGGRWYVSHGDGSYSDCVSCNAGVSTVASYAVPMYAAPTYAVPMYGVGGGCGSAAGGYRSYGPIRGAIKGFFGCGR